MDNVDVVIVGGGAAGLSAALTLGRVRRSVLVLDAGHPRNAPAEGVHGFLSRDGMPPQELSAAGRTEVERYGGVIRPATAVSARRDGDGFVVGTGDGQEVRGRRLLVTTGLVDRLPDIPGLAEQWGHGVVHCPYCHGWEVRDRTIGVLATGPLSVHQAHLFRGLTDDLTLFGNGQEISEEDRIACVATGIRIVDGPVAAVRSGPDGRVAAIELASGVSIACDVVAVGASVEVHTPVLSDLGLHPVPHPSGLGTFYESGVNGETAVPGVFLAGNVTDLAAQVVTAASQGNRAGAWINADLIAESTRAAVQDFRPDFDPARIFSPGYWDGRYGMSSSIWSGDVNAQLPVEAARLTPGRALDVGCGEGGDACWLAAQGWEVVGIDISEVAVQRAALRAEADGVAARTEFTRRDLLEWRPEASSFDLVSAQFMQLPDGVRERVYGALANAVRPGGTLLVVAHLPADAHHAEMPHDLFFTAGQLAAEVLDDNWVIEVAEARHRVGVRHGESVEFHDAVLRARRR